MSLRKIALGSLGITAAALLVTTTVYASTTDSEDHFSLAAGTIVKGALVSGTKMVFNGKVDGTSVTVKCTKFASAGKIPAKGLTVTLSAPPTISGCTDSAGGTDTVKTNQTNGAWKMREVDAASDESATEPNSGDKLKLIIPKRGAVFSSSLLAGCKITVAPSGPASVTGKYNDINTDTVTKAPVPVSASGCTASGTTATAKVILSPKVHDKS